MKVLFILCSVSPQGKYYHVCYHFVPFVLGDQIGYAAGACGGAWVCQKCLIRQCFVDLSCRDHAIISKVCGSSRTERFTKIRQFFK